jgi:hypothetical protein
LISSSLPSQNLRARRTISTPPSNSGCTTTSAPSAQVSHPPGRRRPRHDEHARIETLGAFDPQPNRLPLGHGHHQHAGIGR